MPSSYSLAAGAAVAVYAFLQWLLKYTQDAREPPPLGTSIPFITPIIGMMRKKTKYYIALRDQSKLPIYTLRMPGSRLYIVNAPTLVSAVQRQYKTLAFWPLMAKASVAVAGFSKTAAEIVNTYTVGKDGDPGLLMTFHDATQPALAPGVHLDAMNRVMLGLVASALNRVKEQGVTRVKLFEWVQLQIAMATTDSTYGPGNPYKDPAIRAAQWTFQSGMTNLILGLPATASKQAMTTGAQAFERYFSANHHHQAAELIKARLTHNNQYHVPIPDIARAEFANGVALLSNTIPMTCWLLYHLYADPTALAECRRELAGVEVLPSDATNRILDMSRVKTECPVFLSTYKEVLRLYSAAVSARLVTQDHVLDGQFLLKKGATVLMPSPVQHHNDEIWGASHDAFQYRRFVAAEKEQRKTAAGFRAFGGGTTLCPGRHFATTEILAFAAVMVLQVDVRPVNDKGCWPHVHAEAEFWEATARPGADFEVEIREREDVGEKGWAFVLSDSERVMGLSVEDVEGGEGGH